MLSRTAVPIVRAMPSTTRLVITRSNIFLAKRTFHVSYVSRHDSKASFATIAPEKVEPQSQPQTLPPSPVAADKAVLAKVGPSHLADIKEKRDFHWNHPIYTREEYEAVQVYHTNMSLT